MTRTVLFVHGLESGPQGRKARHLAQAGFTVVSELMPCGRAQVARDPALIAAAVVAAGAALATAWFAGRRGVALAALAAVVAAPHARAHTMRHVFRRSVAVQTRALAAHRVDVVVGSSFGGAVALELLRSGAWSGPTVLLCPAHQLVSARARTAAPGLASLPDEVTARILVVHGRRDETVPLAHSEALVAGSKAQLVCVDDDHRLAATCTPEQLAAWVAVVAGDEVPSA